MEKLVNVDLSKQGALLKEQMPDLDVADLTNWYCFVRGVHIGGADVIDYLGYKKQKLQKTKS